jgi:CRISPR-associated protein Cas2
MLSMIVRTLYIAAYDISDAKRLRLALAVLKEYSTGGQKSVFECFLTPAERKELVDRILAIIDAVEDRFLLMRLDPRAEVRAYGKGLIPENPPYFIVG